MLHCCLSVARRSATAVSTLNRAALAAVSAGGQTQVSPGDSKASLPTVLVIGRPNVGKSTVFNRLAGKRSALVYDTPGSHVTRDYKETIGKLSDLRFRVVDTSGLEPSMGGESIQGRATRLTQTVRSRRHTTKI